MRLAVGVDVGVRKGCHAVALDSGGGVVLRRHLGAPRELGELLTSVPADVVAIDSPPRWAPTGQRSRACERALLRHGIHCFFTPDAGRGSGHRFYEWMEVGFECFAVARAAGHEPLEVFPHACAVALLGSCPPAGTTTRDWRRRALETARVDTAPIDGVDELDAALAAVTGLAWLRGTASVVGYPAEGEIVLPVPRLARRYVRALSTR